MPYEWTTSTPELQTLRLWPYRSLSETGFVWFIGTTAALIALPLVVMVGKPVLWGLLPFRCSGCNLVGTAVQCARPHNR